MRRVTPESGLLRAVTDLLTAERVWWCRMNTGTQVLESANGKRRVFRAGKPGMADILAIQLCAIGSSNGYSCCAGLPIDPDDNFLCRKCGAKAHAEHRVGWIELKSATGRQSDAQKAFQAEVEREGHAYLICRSTDDVVAFLKGNR